MSSRNLTRSSLIQYFQRQLNRAKEGTATSHISTADISALSFRVKGWTWVAALQQVMQERGHIIRAVLPLANHADTPYYPIIEIAYTNLEIFLVKMFI